MGSSKNGIKKRQDCYKLIETLTECGRYRTITETFSREVGGTIGALLIERDAAIADLASICQDSGDACHLCKHFPCAGKSGHCIGWQWRGPQKKEAAHD